MVSSMSHCQPAVNKNHDIRSSVKTDHDRNIFNKTWNFPTDNRVVLKGHFGQGQLFYESANCKQNHRGHQKRPLTSSHQKALF